MLIQHKNGWYEIIKECGYNISQFQITEKENETLILEIIDTPFLFMIRQTPEDFDLFKTNNTEFRPGFPLRTTHESFETDMSKYSIDSVDKQLRRWLNYDVKRYLLEKQLPDLLQEAKNYLNFLRTSSINEEDNESFSEQEKLYLKQGLENFKVLIIEHHTPDNEQLKQINEKLDNLSKAVDNLNRINWKEKAIDTLINLAVTLGLDNWHRLLPLLHQAWEKLAEKIIQIPPQIQ